MEYQVTVEQYDGIGLKSVVESGEWFVGIKNWKPENDIQHIDTLERHLLTDEVFILLSGQCTLLLVEDNDATSPTFYYLPMAPHNVYCIPKGTWHNTIAWPGVKLALIENRNTCADNSEFMSLNSTMRSEIIAALSGS